MKHAEQPELWEAHFCGGPNPPSEHTVHLVGTLEQVVQEVKKTLWWRSDKWTLAELERIGPVRIAKSAKSLPKATPCLELTCTMWSASWLLPNTSE